MYRVHKLIVRLGKEEQAAIQRLAEAERLPTSTLARRLLLQEVDRKELWPALPVQPAGAEVRA